MLKKFLGGIGFLLFGVNILSATPLGTHPNLKVTVWSAQDLASALGASQDYSLTLGSSGIPTITWQTVFSAAPAAVTITLEGSSDCSNYATIDTSTSTSGEIRSISGVYRCVRLNNSAVTTGTGKTLTAYITYGSTLVSSGNFVKLCSVSLGTATTTGTTKQTLGSCIIPAGAFPNKYIGFKLEAFFSAAANTNNKTAGLDIIGPGGGGSLASTTSAATFYFISTCRVSAANTIICSDQQNTGTLGSVANVFAFQLSVTFSSTITINFFATTPTSAGDITLRAYDIYLIKS